jgi:hypothetical protein
MACELSRSRSVRPERDVRCEKIREEILAHPITWRHVRLDGHPATTAAKPVSLMVSTD